MQKLSLIFVISCLLLAGSCSYSLRMNQYPHLRNISILPFENRTIEIFLAEDVRDNLISNFQRDGRLRIVYEEPDSVIEGEIIDYSNTVFGYDMEQNIEEYLVRISFRISFTDFIRNEIIYENKSITLMERYYPGYDGGTLDDSVQLPRFMLTDEESAREKIYEDLFKLIIRNTLEAW